MAWVELLVLFPFPPFVALGHGEYEWQDPKSPEDMYGLNVWVAKCVQCARVNRVYYTCVQTLFEK